MFVAPQMHRPHVATTERPLNQDAQSVNTGSEVTQ